MREPGRYDCDHYKSIVWHEWELLGFKPPPGSHLSLFPEGPYERHLDLVLHFRTEDGREYRQVSHTPILRTMLVTGEPDDDFEKMVTQDLRRAATLLQREIEGGRIRKIKYLTKDESLSRLFAAWLRGLIKSKLPK